MTIVDNDLLSIQEARILAENALQAQKRLASFSQEKLDEIVDAIADACLIHINELAVMSCEETEYGRWQDKSLKSKFVATYAKDQIKDIKCVGIIGKDNENQMMEIGVPVGVIVCLCPVTSPVSTTIYNTLISVKSGNSIIFSPHPRAAKTMARVLDIIIEAAEKAGLPKGCITYLSTVARGGTIELMGHEATSLILNTGVPGMLKFGYEGKKPVVYGGTGHGPAFIERTADISQAVKDIVTSKTFDYGIVPSAEHSIVVEACIERDVRNELVKNGAYFMTEEESCHFASLFFCSDKKVNHQMVGVSAKKIAQMAGFNVPENVSVLIAKRKYVSDLDPFSREMLCPVLTYYVEDDWINACEKCIELLLSERNGHTLAIHSKDQEVIKQFALKKPVGRLLVNTPATFGGLGITTNLFPSMTLGSGLTGDGITSDNVSPLNLIYIRKVGYGVRDIKDLGLDQGGDKTSLGNALGLNRVLGQGNIESTIEKILKEAIQALNS